MQVIVFILAMVAATNQAETIVKPEILAKPPPTTTLSPTTLDPIVYCWQVLGNQLSCQGGNQQSGFNTPCMNTCLKRNYGDMIFCPYTPKLGCFCSSGYLYNNAGVCVLATSCPCNSSLREHYISWNRNAEACPANAASASTATVTGCFCKPAYCRNASNNCVYRSIVVVDHEISPM